MVLLRSRRDDLDELVDAINGSLGELERWMPWAEAPATVDSVRRFLDQADAEWGSGRGFAFGIRSVGDRGSGDLLGYCGLHDRVGSGGLEIGYWVRSDRTGRGVATTAAGLLTRSALGLQGIRRVEIHCDAANAASASIAAKLGYRLDRVRVRPPRSPGETERQLIWTVTGRP